MIRKWFSSVSAGDYDEENQDDFRIKTWDEFEDVWPNYLMPW